jgi:hypothetical protein
LKEPIGHTATEYRKYQRMRLDQHSIGGVQPIPLVGQPLRDTYRFQMMTISPVHKRQVGRRVSQYSPSLKGRQETGHLLSRKVGTRQDLVFALGGIAFGLARADTDQAKQAVFSREWSGPPRSLLSRLRHGHKYGQLLLVSSEQARNTTPLDLLGEGQKVRCFADVNRSQLLSHTLPYLPRIPPEPVLACATLLRHGRRRPARPRSRRRRSPTCRRSSRRFRRT